MLVGIKASRRFESWRAQATAKIDSLYVDYRTGSGMQLQANTAWALATLSYNPGDQNLEAIAEHSKNTLGTFSPQNISNTLWAFATLSFHAKVVLGSIVNCLLKADVSYCTTTDSIVCRIH